MIDKYADICTVTGKTEANRMVLLMSIETVLKIGIETGIRIEKLVPWSFFNLVLSDSNPGSYSTFGLAVTEACRSGASGEPLSLLSCQAFQSLLSDPRSQRPLR